MTSSLYNERDQLRQTRIRDRYWVTDQGNDKEVLKMLLRIELEEKRMGIECKNLFLSLSFLFKQRDDAMLYTCCHSRTSTEPP